MSSAESVSEKSHSEKKSRLWRVPFTTSKTPAPPLASIEDSLLIPEATAGWLSIVTFNWISGLLSLGYARPLEAPDLYKLQAERGSGYIADLIDASFERRQRAAEEYNARLASGDIKPGMKALWWTLRGNRAKLEKEWREVHGKRKASLVWAMNDSVKWWFWSSGVLKVIGDTAQVTSPLLVKAIINFATESFVGHRTGGPVPHIGKGIGLTFGLLALQVIASLATHHFFYRSTSTGVLLRGGLITVIYKRSLRLTSRARSTLTNGKLVNHISTDVSRIDFCCGFFHMAWTAPVQMIICLILLILNLGPSASLELLGGMKVIKFFAWEIPFLNRIFGYRKNEMGYIRSLLIIRAANNAIAISMPILASVLAFVTYSLTGHELRPDVIFASLTLFTLLRLPLMFLPISFSAIADAKNATERLYGVFEAELLTTTYTTEASLSSAIHVQNASFTWDSPPPNSDGGKKKPKDTALQRQKDKEIQDKADEAVFKIPSVSMDVQRGQLVAIVGPVGSGKTSLLQGIIGEMRRTDAAGEIKFGGTVGYCPQSAWIQNATIRENICFGRPFEEERYWRAIRDACLEPDLDMLPNGDLTEVGEKGISLSGGQKQRLNICRAIYCDTDIQILMIRYLHSMHTLGRPFSKRTPQQRKREDSSEGRIAERGTYIELMANNSEFSKFVREFGSSDDEEGDTSKGVVSEVDEAAIQGAGAGDDKRKPAIQGATMMQAEERNTGAISWGVYKEYSNAGNGKIVLPLLLLGLVLVQGASTMASYWLVYWQELKWARPQGFYMGIYAFLGVSQALANFLMGSMFAMLTFFASQTLHKRAIERVMHAPMSFFETTVSIFYLQSGFAQLLADVREYILCHLGAVILISIVLPWFLIGVFCITIGYLYAAAFYRASARELKRLDAVLRSSLYSHFSESLSGLATIRAYGETERFRSENEKRVDVENRAYWLTVTNQRWLGIRLDFLGALLTFLVAMLAVGTRFTISPSQTGLVLSYILSVQQAFGWLVRQSAEVENNMNSVERIVHYATEIEQEAPHDLPDNKPPSSWPADGQLELRDIVLNYRPELPPVLKGISMTVKAGEKIGIVGRTGAGKSSIMTALYRLVELTSGSMFLDGVDISKVGLADLRKGLAIIPQDPLLFSGTLRSNLDPFNVHDDATLWDALKRSYLVESTKRHSLGSDDGTPSGAHTPVNRFTLDSIIEDEGGNLSIGQRSLVSLARALVKNAKVIILDEATASVDYETDRNIQDTIAYEFQDRTILCIAHRLRTIISYDRICVLDAGKIAEFDTPSRLYDNPNGIFRGMCDRSSISFDDIKLATKITAERQKS
ncbi:ABC transporter [Infundibulicybe gibba]|nr:ABC transporter [Infundibulicybe gibba]